MESFKVFEMGNLHANWSGANVLGTKLNDFKINVNESLTFIN